MFLRVKVEKKILHYTLSSREWTNVLYITSSSEDPPLGLIDRQSILRWGLLTREATSTERCLLQMVSRIPSTRVPTNVIDQRFNAQSTVNFGGNGVESPAENRLFQPRVGCVSRNRTQCRGAGESKLWF